MYIFSIWVFFHEHSRFTGEQGKGEAISLTPLYHFHPLHGHLDVNWGITANFKHTLTWKKVMTTCHKNNLFVHV